MRVIFQNDWMLLEVNSDRKSSRSVRCSAGEYELELIKNPVRSGGPPWLIIKGTSEGASVGAPKFIWQGWAKRDDCELILDEEGATC